MCEHQTQDPDKSGLTLKQYSWYFDQQANEQYYACNEDLLIAKKFL